MSIPAPTRHLVSRCISSRSFPVQCHQRRAAVRVFVKSFSSSTRQHRPQEKKPTQANPVLDEYLRKNPQTPLKASSSMPESGDLGSTSIFEEDRLVNAQLEDSEAPADEGLPGRKRANIARITDPNPDARERWERKKVIQLVRRGGRLSRRQLIARTEREHLAKSHNLKTSVKKLGKLARQIAGKTIDDAIVQMRFSKKKAAVEVLAQLEAARNEAVVVRGMGLGQVALQGEQGNGQAPGPKKEAPVEIKLKDGSSHVVSDRSKIYIEQAWVGRGPYGKLPEYRARGRVNLLRTPWTSISVVLKEEATRIREWQEREAKRKKQRTGSKVWVAMPDRPIPTQRQWYSW